MKSDHRRASLCAMLIGAIAICFSEKAAAQSRDVESGAPLAAFGNGWQFNVTPYAWATWLEGDQTVRGRTVDVDVDPIELIDHLDRMPFMGYAEARKGPLAFYTDIVYANVGLNADGVRSRSLGPGISGTLSAAVGLDIEQTILEAGASYEVAQWSTAGNGTTTLDILAGARYWHQQADIRLALDVNLDVRDLILSGSVARARSGDVDWVDPVVGAAIRHQIASGQDLLLRGDIGGFGAGSEFSWNVVAAYSFEICNQNDVIVSGVLGYRLLDVDFEKGSGRTKYEYDILQHGPLMGFSLQF